MRRMVDPLRSKEPMLNPVPCRHGMTERVLKAILPCTSKGHRRCGLREVTRLARLKAPSGPAQEGSPDCHSAYTFTLSARADPRQRPSPGRRQNVFRQPVRSSGAARSICVSDTSSMDGIEKGRGKCSSVESASVHRGSNFRMRPLRGAITHSGAKPPRV
jgi:hypothetical protein